MYNEIHTGHTCAASRIRVPLLDIFYVVRSITTILDKTTRLDETDRWKYRPMLFDTRLDADASLTVPNFFNAKNSQHRFWETVIGTSKVIKLCGLFPIEIYDLQLVARWFCKFLFLCATHSARKIILRRKLIRKMLSNILHRLRLIPWEVSTKERNQDSKKRADDSSWSKSIFSPLSN